MGVIEKIYYYKEAADIEIKKAPKTTIKKIVYIYDRHTNEYNPVSAKHLKLNPDVSKDDIDIVSIE